mmetsp:Transcript_26130/g.50029  ORF Transcript_26130/g.50029 Transcript_26130/m.50029 type:complete len:123 (-) Transcript_26130:399-767(-)
MLCYTLLILQKQGIRFIAAATAATITSTASTQMRSHKRLRHSSRCNALSKFTCKRKPAERRDMAATHSGENRKQPSPRLGKMVALQCNKVALLCQIRINREDGNDHCEMATGAKKTRPMPIK